MHDKLKVGFLVIAVLSSLFLSCSNKKQWENKKQEVERLYNEEKFEEAEKVAKESLDLARKVYGPLHVNVARSMNNLALIYKAGHRNEEAAQLYEQSLEIKRKILDSDDPSIANTLNNLAVLYAAEGELMKSEPYFKDALRIYVKTPQDNLPNLIAVLDNLVKLYSQLGDKEEAHTYQSYLDKLKPKEPMEAPVGY